MEFGLHTRLDIKLNPQLMYALKLLQYTTLELAQEVKLQLEENPLLETVGDDLETGAGEGEPDDAEPEEPVVQMETVAQELKPETRDIDWDEYVNSSMNTEQNSREEFEKKEEQNLLDREGKSGTTLEQHLLEQFYLLDISNADRTVGEYLIGSLEDTGLLTAAPEEIASELGVEPSFVERVLGMIQTLEPPGVGARTIPECLLIQLRAVGQGDSLAAVMIERYWGDLCNRRVAVLKKALKVEQEDIQEALQTIGTLNPHPGRSISDEMTIPILPDLVVDKVDGEYVVTLNDRHMPRLRVSRAYQGILSRGSHATDSERDYVRKKLKDAIWLVSSIEQRRSTMLKVMSFIVKAQREFLDKGLPHLKPMILQEVADQVGVHPATVSRVTQNKYVQTPRGVFALKYFFDGSISTDSGDTLSTKAVRDRLAKFIREESPDDPRSDETLTGMLQAEGLNIQRRTVAKYRGELGIPTARMRKRI
ncbi:MAG: RNA polymerase factor sigma-54 [candidate division Zixibacteria bacterium]|nr:RNA polymerase factor sigma-54 [candidate division Zixibacteria bacterium]